MTELQGWLLDLFAHRQDGLVLWLLGEDGRRQRLCQDFPVSFYAAGENERLRAAWRWLRSQEEDMELSRQERRDLFLAQPRPVLAIGLPGPHPQPGLFRRLAQAFPDLDYYDADLPLAVRHAARYGTFPLARLRLQVQGERVLALEALESRWELDPAPAPLRMLRLQPDCNPGQGRPQQVLLQFERYRYRLALAPARALLVNLAAILARHDPDLLLSLWGDSWLLPHLLQLSRQSGLPLALNREPGRGVARKAARSYQAYGQVVYRGPQVTLFGRWHIDAGNAVMFHDYDLAGVLEMARLSALPVQTAARVSPGTGISAMQIQTALRWGVLVPWRKQQAERFKSAGQLLHADKGGLVYQPTTGLHAGVAEIDFVSMYPSVMVHFNISPETVGAHQPGARLVPELGLQIDQEREGLVPATLRPLLEKRIALKQRLLELSPYDRRHQEAKARAAAHKWLLVTCFGYLGYKNARFGRIEAHEAVTAYGREALLRAKEAAEDLGYRVLHMYVDGLWVQKDGAGRAEDIQPLLDQIVARCGLPISLEGLYNWIAFLPSRGDRRVPVANCYFGAFAGRRAGERLKLRGIAARRHDTPPFIKELQLQMLASMAAVPAEALVGQLPELLALAQGSLAQLRGGRLPLASLVVNQQLSRPLAEYRSPSPAARAAAQLAEQGQETRPGQYVRFIYTLGRPGVQAWDLGGEIRPQSVAVERYSELLLRAAHTILAPLGVEEATLRDWLFSRAGYGAPPGQFSPQPRQAVIFGGVKQLEAQQVPRL